MHSWTDSTLTSLNSWVVWAGVGTTILGLLATILGIGVSNELARRDGIKDREREQLLTSLQESAKRSEAALQRRALDMSRRGEMLKELQGAPQLKLEIHFPNGHEEPEQLAHQIGALLTEAKLTFRGGPLFGSQAAPGVTVNHGTDEQSRSFAAALTRAITIGGVTATAAPENGSDGQVTIDVGRKP